MIGDGVSKVSTGKFDEQGKEIIEVDVKRPKYFYPAPRNVFCNSAHVDFGDELAFLVISNPKPDQHESIVANEDAYGFPEDLGVVCKGDTKLEECFANLKIPSGWMNGLPYKEVINRLFHLFRFKQRCWRDSGTTTKGLEPTESLDEIASNKSQILFDNAVRFGIAEGELGRVSTVDELMASVAKAPTISTDKFSAK